MLNLIDVEKSLGIEANKKKNALLFFVLVTTIVIFLDALLIIESKDDYFWNLFFSTVFSIVYLIYLVFYFVVIRPTYARRVDLLGKIYSSEHTQYNGEIISFEETPIDYDEMEFYVANVKIIGSIKDEIKTFYFPQKVELNKKNRYVLDTFGKIVISLGAKA